MAMTREFSRRHPRRDVAEQYRLRFGMGEYAPGGRRGTCRLPGLGDVGRGCLFSLSVLATAGLLAACVGVYFLLALLWG